jgi:tetratricopeptide (TPR) repeat protein
LIGSQDNNSAELVSHDSHARLSNRWFPAVPYALPRAPHFAGREELLAELSTWARAESDPDRVVALIAAGGTGKSVLMDKILTSLADYTTAGVFVWSFDANPQTEPFLRAACEYFFDKAPRETGGLLKCMQEGLRVGNLPHLLILDGIEAIQTSGDTGHLRGKLKDPLMKQLLCWIAAGHNTKAKILITSRFPLPELDQYRGQGFKSYNLADLDLPAARVVLRNRGVKGDNATLDVLAESVHRHALTLDVLGLYLVSFGESDPKNAPKFDLEAVTADIQGEGLNKVLTSYAAELPKKERDLLVRMSLFPGGISVEYLEFIVGAGGEIAGALIGSKQARLLSLLNGLKELGLVFISESKGSQTYTAHPFLRDFFRTLLGTLKAEQVFKIVRDKISFDLKESPEKPTTPKELDHYERVIEITRLAGDSKKAFDLYWHVLGNYHHLGNKVGNYDYGLRILSAFSTDGTPAKAGLTLPEKERANLVNDWGQFAKNRGDLSTARQAFATYREIYQSSADHQNLSVIRQNLADQQNLSACFDNLADVELAAGRWPEARNAAAAALRYVDPIQGDDSLRNSHALLATAFAGLGLLAKAKHHYAEATRLGKETMLYSFHGVRHAEFKLMLKDRNGARIQSEANLEKCRQQNWIRAAALCHTLLGRSNLPENQAQALEYLNEARAYANRSGDIEITLRCYHLAAEVARCERNFPAASAEAQDGIQLADLREFGRWSLDLRMELAKIHLETGDDPKLAIDLAEWVVKRSQEKDCQYAWGIADSLPLLCIAYARVND